MSLRIDRETVRGDDGSVDQAASADANLKAAGEDLKKILPDKTSECLHAIFDKGGGDYSGIGKAFALAQLPVMIAVDAVEVALMPIVAVKDGIDAAVHGIAAGVKKLFHHK